MTNRISLVIHGGAGQDSEFIQRNITNFGSALTCISREGYEILSKNKTAIESVFEFLMLMEDNPLFNAGRGSALNEYGKVEMCAGAMEGKTLSTGAVSLVQMERYPSQLVSEIMRDTSHAILGAHGASTFAKDKKLQLEPEGYSVTDHQVESFLKKRNESNVQEKIKEKLFGTVGVVACDSKGNVAAGTSSGETENSMSGRIGDSSVIGSGFYANNQTCAISTTGDGEFIIRGVLAHYNSCYMEFTGAGVQQACDFSIHEKNKNAEGNIGVIAVTVRGSDPTEN